MNPLLLKFADGTSFFVGMALLLATILPQMWLRQRTVRTCLSIAGMLGVVLVVLSSTPLSTGQYVVWLLFYLAALLTLNVRNRNWDNRQARLLTVGLLVALSLMLCLQELRFHLCPRIVLRADQPVYVIGDSLSAGIGRGERVWPAVLAARSGLTVHNLAAGGSKVADALQQAQAIPRDGSLVIVEIGGNDVLGNGQAPTDTAVFRRQLDELLAVLDRRKCKLAMFELPLPPLSNRFGRAQRTLAAKYGVALIPKSCLADTLGLEGGTLDGLHLSQKGHDHLAASVQTMLHR